MGRGALKRDNQQSTFAHIHTSSSHSTTSLWSPIPYPHCVSTGLILSGGLSVMPVRTGRVWRGVMLVRTGRVWRSVVVRHMDKVLPLLVK